MQIPSSKRCKAGAPVSEIGRSAILKEQKCFKSKCLCAMLQYIANFLTVEDMDRCSDVSNCTRKVLYSPGYWIRLQILSFGNFYAEDNINFAELPFKHCNQITTLQYGDGMEHGINHPLSSLFKQFAQRCKTKLQHLRVKNRNLCATSYLLTQVEQLRTLSIEGDLNRDLLDKINKAHLERMELICNSRYEPLDKQTPDIILAAPCLTHLVILHVPYQLELRTPKLESIKFGHCMFYWPENISAYKENINELEINSISSWKQTVFNELMQFRNLRVLKLNFGETCYNKETFNLYLALTLDMPYLRTLSLTTDPNSRPRKLPSASILEEKVFDAEDRQNFEKWTNTVVYKPLCHLRYLEINKKEKRLSHFLTALTLPLDELVLREDPDESNLAFANTCTRCVIFRLCELNALSPSARYYLKKKHINEIYLVKLEERACRLGPVPIDHIDPYNEFKHIDLYRGIFTRYMWAWCFYFPAISEPI